MAPAKRSARARSKAAPPPDADEVLARLRKMAKASVRAGMARYGIPDDNALGISVGDLKKLAKSLGRSHELAAGLWDTGVYEARMLATFVDDPAEVTSAQMDRWRSDFDSWAICDTACFALFDRTEHAWAKVKAWAKLRDEFGKRAAFALLASLTVHDKEADDSLYADGLLLIERGAADERNFVKKGVNWALRSIGKRNAALHAAALAVAQRLSESEHAGARWVGADALRELKGKSVSRRLAGKKKSGKSK
jgi:3-methyladenine DNA glycosylase AlkD